MSVALLFALISIIEPTRSVRKLIDFFNSKEYQIFNSGTEVDGREPYREEPYRGSYGEVTGLPSSVVVVGKPRDLRTHDEVARVIGFKALESYLNRERKKLNILIPLDVWTSPHSDYWSTMNHIRKHYTLPLEAAHNGKRIYFRPRYVIKVDEDVYEEILPTGVYELPPSDEGSYARFSITSPK